MSSEPVKNYGYDKPWYAIAAQVVTILWLEPNLTHCLNISTIVLL